MSNIPLTIKNLVAEATSEYNDGFIKAEAKRILKEINEYINNALISKKATQNFNTKSMDITVVKKKEIYSS